MSENIQTENDDLEGEKTQKRRKRRRNVRENSERKRKKLIEEEEKEEENDESMFVDSYLEYHDISGDDFVNTNELNVKEDIDVRDSIIEPSKLPSSSSPPPPMSPSFVEGSNENEIRGGFSNQHFFGQEQLSSAFRQNGVFVENVQNGKFHKWGHSMEEIFQEEAEEEAEERRRKEEESKMSGRKRIVGSYQKYPDTLYNLSSGVFFFCKGLFAGVSFLFLFVVYFPFDEFSYDSFYSFLEPVASTIQKIFLFLTTICLVCAVFECCSRWKAKETNKLFRLSFILQAICYILLHVATLICCISEDYFSSCEKNENCDLTKQSLKRDFFFFLWNIANGFRCIFCLFVFIVDTFLRLTTNIHKV